MGYLNNNFTDVNARDYLAHEERARIDWGDQHRFAALEMVRNGDSVTGIKLPWDKTHDIVRLKPGDVSVWAGINGHMKSMVLGQVALWAAREHKVGVMSFEMPIANTMHRMICQASSSSQPAIRFANDLSTWMDQRICFYDRLDTVPPATVLSAVLEMARGFGCELIVVDSLMMCGVTDDMQLERMFLAELTGLAKALNIHIALVHHVRKPAQGGDTYVPSRFDVKGSGAIVDMASQLFICWNNKRKRQIEQRVEFTKIVSPDDSKVLEEPDQKLIVAKHRHGHFEGPINLWMHPSMQFVPSASRHAMPFDIPRL